MDAGNRVNCTIEELKHIHFRHVHCGISSVNCTIEELKHSWGVDCKHYAQR